MTDRTNYENHVDYARPQKHEESHLPLSYVQLQYLPQWESQEQVEDKVISLGFHPSHIAYNEFRVDDSIAWRQNQHRKGWVLPGPI